MDVENYRLFLMRLLTILFLLFCQQAWAETTPKDRQSLENRQMALEITVSNSAELMAALGKATGGETIILEAGDYGTLSLKSLNFADAVTIKSDPTTPAEFYEINVSTSSGLVFDGIEVNHPKGADEQRFNLAVSVRDSSDITIMNSNIHGSDDSDYSNDLKLVDFNGSSNISFLNNLVHDGAKGITFLGVDGFVAKGNEIYDMEEDGFNVVNSSNGLIDDNYIHDFHPTPGTHPDAIQFWTSGEGAVSENVVISNNTIMKGEGDTFQSIFMRTLEDTGFNNIEITGNLIYSDHSHGISVWKGSDVLIESNTLLAVPGNLYIPYINVFSAQGAVSVNNNVTSGLYVDDVSEAFTSLTNNVLASLKDPSAPEYYGNLFQNPFSGPLAVESDFEPLDGSILIQTDNVIGALTQSTSSEELTARALSEGYLGSADSMTVDFDASTTMDQDGFVDEADAQFIWDFGDGTTAEGVKVSHT